MALVDLDSWVTEFESCGRLSNTLLSQLKQREGKLEGSPDYNRFTLAIQVGIRQFERELQQLKFKLDESTKAKTITFEEVEHRQRQLDTLQSQRQQINDKYTNSASRDRAALLETNKWASTSNRSGDGIGEDSDAAPIIDVQRLKQTQIEILEEQNQGLETLSQTLSRQRVLATQLGQEVEDQNEILDNLANTMERVESGVGRETQNISLVSRRDSTWGYWIVIIVLFVAIVIVGIW